MQLEFEIIEEINAGTNTNIVHFWDNQVQTFYIKNGKLMSKIARMNNGDWTDLDFIREKELVESENIQFLDIAGVFDNIVIGTYIDNNTQKMILYEY